MRRLFRTHPLSGPEAGWLRPAFAVILALVIPAGFCLFIIVQSEFVFNGPPKDGSDYTLKDHVSLVIGALSVSFLASWMMIPFAIFALRLALMTGWAGCVTAMGAAVVIGLPLVHVGLSGDVTTEENAILPHVTVAIALLGLAVWAFYWGLFRLRRKKEAG